MKRPLLMVALLFAAGVWVGDHSTVPPAWTLGVGMALGLAGLAAPRSLPWVLPALLFVSGLAAMRSCAVTLSPVDLRTLIGDRPVLASVRGRLLETPELRLDFEAPEKLPRCLARLEVTALRLKKRHWEPAFGRVIVTSFGALPEEYHRGQVVEVSGTLQSPPEAVAPGLFDYAAYLRRQGIHHQLLSSAGVDWRALPPRTKPPLSDRFLAWARRTLALGLPEQDEPLRLLWAMTLGWKTGLNGDVAAPFMRSGTMHIFAISGLHVALIAGIAVGVLRFVRLSRAWSGWIVIPLLWAYTGVTGWQASAVRSTLMMSVIIAGWSLHRPSDLINSLAAAALLILLWEPQQLFQAGFQLSFMVVLALALAEPLSTRVAARVRFVDPLLPRELAPLWRRAGEAAVRWLARGAATSTVAWLGSIPLVAAYFHLITPVSVLANLVVVPLSSFALASTMASLAVGGWWPWGAEIFNHGAWLWMRWMVTASQAAAELPGAWAYAAAPSAAGFALYYAVFIGLGAGVLKRPAVRVWWCAGISLLAVFWIAGCLHEAMTPRLVVLPLRGGHAVWSDAPGRQDDLLADTGNDDAVKFISGPYLKSEGRNRLPHLLLTHGDIHHVEGAPTLDLDLRIGELVIGPRTFRSAAYRNVVETFERAPRPVRSVQRSERIGSWRVLHPAAEDRFTQADDQTLVLLAEIMGTRVLLLSDLGPSGQHALLTAHSDLRADVVISGLPGRGEPLADALLEALRPELIVVADDLHPATARAGTELRLRLNRHPATVLFTSDTRAVTLNFSKTGWELTAANGQRLTHRRVSPPSP